jgi:uncharacterized protein (TIGR02265 family)
MTTPISGKLFDGVFHRVLAGDVPAEVTQKLGELGVDLGALQPHYPRELWYRAIAETAAALYPSDAGQLRKLGRRIVSSLVTKNLIKGPWVGMAKLLGPRRGLKQAIERMDHSVVKLSVHEKSKHEFEIVADETEQAEFLAGLIEGALELLGGRDAKTVVVGPRGTSTVFSATWR